MGEGITDQAQTGQQAHVGASGSNAEVSGTSSASARPMTISTSVVPTCDRRWL
jgi:hypothetical protein